MCSAKVGLGSRVRPRILGNGLVARILLFIWRLSDLEYSAGSGVSKVVCVLLVLRMRFCAAQVVIGCRYGCMIVSVVLYLVWVAVMVKSSVYLVRFMSGWGCQIGTG